MNLTEVKEWVLVGTGVLTLLSIAVTSVSVAIGSWNALKEYGLKQQAEARAAKKEEAETDVRLLTAFTELMDIANGRGGYEVSEKMIEELFKHKAFTEQEWSDLESLRNRIGEFPVIYKPVGLSSQHAAIAAIATLANRHRETLKDAAIQALESANANPNEQIKELAKKHLQRISNA
jgi:cell division protein FtsL